jgi:hypothetical protein
MNATDLPRPDESEVHSEVVLTHLARATVELEDLATDSSPAEAMVRIGDATAGIRLVGDLITIQGLLADAHRQLTHLQQKRGRQPS